MLMNPQQQRLRSASPKPYFPTRDPTFPKHTSVNCAEELSLLGVHSMASLQIMIAEKGSRRKGLAQEALTLFMAYTAKYLVGLHLAVYCEVFYCVFITQGLALSHLTLLL